MSRWIAGADLLPRPSALTDLRVRNWYAPLFALTDRPQKPTLRAAHEQLLSAWRAEWADPPGSPPPSYDQVLRVWQKRSRFDQAKGRNTGSALRAKTFYQHRTYAGMQPADEVHADGWNTHYTAPHPVTGEFVTREVWHFHDVATRYVPPFGIGFTENSDVILQGLQHAIRELGVMAIWQTDHTGSVKNAKVMDEHAGLADRLGITVVHPVEVGNSNANGIAENFNTWLDRESRELATYQHPQRMDSGTFVRMRRITNAMVRAKDKPEERAKLRQKAMNLGKGIVFDTDAQALAWLETKRVKWNNHPHSALPKQRDPATGRLVHMSPQQALDASRAAGWEPLALPEPVLVDQFRPHYRKKVTRGTVSPFGGMRYRHEALDALEGDEVLVAVQPDEPAHVWVKDLLGRPIVQAQFVAAVGPRTESMQEHTDRKRAEAQIRLRETQIAAIEARIAPAAIEAPARPVFELPPLAPAAGGRSRWDEPALQAAPLRPQAPSWREPGLQALPLPPHESHAEAAAGPAASSQRVMNRFETELHLQALEAQRRAQRPAGGSEQGEGGDGQDDNNAGTPLKVARG